MRRKTKRFFNGSLFTFISLIFWELLEEVLEESLAFGITRIVSFAISSVFVISLTQATKIVIKSLVKNLTYREGKDKMNWLKKTGQFLNSNKFSLLATLSTVIGVLSGTGVVDYNSLPAINVGAFNISPVIYWLIIGALSVLGISKQGWETIKGYTDRIAKERELKEQKAIEKEAEAKLKAETLVVDEKAEAKAQAEAEAKAEHDRKVQEAYEKLKAQAVNNGGV